MKKQIISESKLREIIKEEALRMKKRITLENEKKTLLKKLNEMYMEDSAADDNTDDGECDGSMAGAMGEGQEMEEGIFSKTDHAADADQKLTLPAYKKAAQEAVSAIVRKGAEAVGDWAKHFFEGKDITDQAQANEVFKNMLGTYKNLWKSAYIANKGNMANMVFNPLTGAFEKGSGPSSGTWFTGLAGEGKEPKI
jgi:hypothetical protein